MEVNKLTQALVNGIATLPVPPGQMVPMPYGAQCTWWDSMDKVGKLDILGMDHPIPCCPICKGVLMQVDDKSVWDKNVQDYAIKNNDPEYPKFVEWLRGRCYRDHEVARTAFNNKDKGK